jgi:SET domain-containing protein
MWGDEEPKKVAICFGFGSMYNHSYEPNATYKKRLNENVIEFIAIRPLKKDEEISVNYNYGRPDDKSELWIEDIKPYTE